MANRRTTMIGKFILALTMAIGIPAATVAQEYENTPVSISKEKVRIDGTICYSHIVLERQTLFSISKAYGVSLEDIYRYNPSVKENGLKKNSILIIPCIQEDAPAQVAEADEVQAAADDEVKTHIVKWYEDLDVIAEKYGVTVEALMKANGLKGRKLSKRQKLIIPSSSAVSSEDEAPVIVEDKVIMEDTTELIPEPIAQEEDKDGFGWLFPDREVAVSLLLPLKADGAQSSQNNMDFYSGVLLAVYDLAEEGVKTELSVYDVAGGNLPVTRERIEKSDIVIGPVSSGNIGRLFELAPDAKAVVSPLDPRAESLVSAHENMIQAPVPHKFQYEDLAAWLKEDKKYPDKVIVITEKGARQSPAVDMMKAAVDSTGISYSPFSYSILEGRNVTEPLIRLMTDKGTNRFLIASESEAFVNDVVRNLNVLAHKKYDIVLYAPSKIRSFETIEAENFHNVNMHVSLGYYIDYSDKDVMDFIMKYRALFNTEPTQFAFQGYDTAAYFIRMCSRYGHKWPSKIGEDETSMLQSTFRCTKTEDGGYINSGVRRIIYSDDWSVSKVR